MKHSLNTCLLFAIIFCYSVAFTDDWPQWRGLNRDGVWRETGVIQNLDKKPLKVKWRAEISSGYSGPTVADGRVFVTDFVKSHRDRERVLCFDAMTGKKLWSHEYDCQYRGIGYPAGPRASVTIDGSRAYALGAMGYIHCLEVSSGRVIWKRDLNKEYDIKIPTWGIAAAPLVENNLIILQIGGRNGACIVGLDKLTGREIWRALDDAASYSAPIIIRQAGKRVVVVWAGQQVVGLDPVTGGKYWQHPFIQSRTIQSIATPVLYNHYLFVSSFFDGSLLLKVRQDKLAVASVWRRKGRNERQTESLHCCISTPLLKGDYIYGIDSYGELRCLDLYTGERIWEDLTVVNHNRWANVHMVQNGDRTWMFNEHGELILAELSSNGLHEIGRQKIIEPTTEQLNRSGEGVTWAHPAFANKHIYVRSDNELVCINVSAI